MTTSRILALTHVRLQELLHYDPETGVFTWRVDRTGKAKAGTVAGSLNTRGYVNIYIDGVPHRAHRLAWFYMQGRWPNPGVDHENTVKSDNRWLNLREATQKDNNGNSNIRKDNKSGFKGVCFHKASGKYTATITLNRKPTHLGCFTSKEEAAAAYATAAREHFGEFARP